MKRVSLAVVGWLLGAASFAQTGLDSPQLARERIQQERERAQLLFQAQDEECRKKFAVTGCARQVELRRREHAARLRREEAVLNDGDRQQRALQASRAREQRELERAQRGSGPTSASAPASGSTAEVQAVPGPVAVDSEPVRPPKAPAISKEQAVRNRSAFDARQKALAERQAARTQRLHEAAKQKPPQPLPQASAGVTPP